jgi:hypothetical protein
MQGLSGRKRISLEKLTDDEKLEKRRERLVGRTVKGVLIRNRQNFAVKWNDCQFDNVYVSERCVELCLGPRPERGVVAVVKCQIKTIGPTNAPWYLQHPYTDVVELVTRYRRKRRQSKGWMHSGMPKALTRIQFSRDSSTMASRKASIVVSPRGTVVNEDSELPNNIKVIPSRRGSEVIIEGGKRWEYKPPVRGPMHLPEGWEMRAIRFNGSTYFVPSPPGSRRNTWSKQAARRSRKGSQRRSKGPKRKSTTAARSSRSRPSAADKKAAVKLIKQIEREERREAERSRRGSTKSAKKARSKSKSPKKEKAKPKSKSAKKPAKGKKEDEPQWHCRKCDHDFKLEQGLNDHLLSKHKIKRRTSLSASKSPAKAETGRKSVTAKKDTRKKPAEPRRKSATKPKKGKSPKKDKPKSPKKEKAKTPRKSIKGGFKCKKCEGTYKTETGLDDHLFAKHDIKRGRHRKPKSKPSSPRKPRSESKLRRETKTARVKIKAAY